MTPVTGTLVMAATLVAFILLGLRAGRDTDVEAFTSARNSQGGTTLGLSFLAAGMGAWILFAPPEVGAGVGIDGLMGYAIGAAVPVLLFALLGGRIRRVMPDGMSLGEFARRRFGRAFGTWVSLVSVAYMFFFVTAELTSVAGVTGIVAGVDSRLTVVAVVLATLAYTSWGGLRASLVTDRWQSVLIVGLLAVGFVAAASALSSPGSALSASGLLGVDDIGVEVALTLLIAVAAANMFHQGYWQRVWAARDDRSLTTGALLGAAVTIPVVLLVGLFGLLAVGAGLESPIPFFALMEGLPTAIAALVIVLGVALVASSVDTLQTGLFSTVAAERPSMSLGRGRLVMVALMVPATIIAVQGLSVLRLFLIADLICAGAVVPLLSGLWRRATSAGALSGAVAGLLGAVGGGWLTTGSLAEGLRLATIPGAPTLPPFAGALIASTVVTVAVSLAGRQVVDLTRLPAPARPGAAQDEAAPAPV